MYPVKQPFSTVVAGALLLGGSIALQATAQASPAVFDGSSLVLNIPEVDVHSGTDVSSWTAQLHLVTATPPYVLELISASPIAPASAADRSTFFGDTSYVHLPDVQVGGQSFYVRMKRVAGSNPLRFEVDQLVENNFTGCPAFASPGPVSGSCFLSGEIHQDITLTSNIQWLLQGGVYIGGDKTNSATITINPGTKVLGQSGADFLYIRRNSKIFAEGTPNKPIVMTGPLEQNAGEWGGLLLAGNAPVNGCAASVDPCEIAFEAIATEKFGGNDVNDNSGVLKYTQVKFAGFAVRPNEELNGITMLGVGAGTLVDYVQVHRGLDDGIEMFGGTVQMKHLVLTENADDSLDWGIGWRGKSQFVLIKQAADTGDRGFEADNNPDNNDIEPRSKPMLANITALGSSAGSQGALLRRGTGANFYNAVFQGFGDQCLRINGTSTYNNAGTPGSLTGQLTIVDSYVNCTVNFKDEASEPFLTSNWFHSQSGNVEGDPQLNGYLPAPGSPLINNGHNIPDVFFNSVDYIGAFKDENDDWTHEWTSNL